MPDTYGGAEEHLVFPLTFTDVFIGNISLKSPVRRDQDNEQQVAIVEITTNYISAFTWYIGINGFYYIAIGR